MRPFELSWAAAGSDQPSPSERDISEDAELQQWSLG